MCSARTGHQIEHFRTVLSYFQVGDLAMSANLRIPDVYDNTQLAAMLSKML